MRVDLPGGIHLNIHSRGGGERTALLIHGWAVCGDIWSPVLDAWPADGPRLLAPDLRGTGWSSKPQDGYTLENYAADIVALIDKLERSPPSRCPIRAPRVASSPTRRRPTTK